MKIIIVGSGSPAIELQQLVIESLTSLSLIDAVSLDLIDDPAYKLDLGITQNPALAIEESTIDFRDMIFEGMVPDKAELDAMFLSILGSDDTSASGGGCGTGGCGTCATGCGSEEKSCSTDDGCGHDHDHVGHSHG